MEGEKEGEEELTSSSIASREVEVREAEKDPEEYMSSDRDSTGEGEWFWKKMRGQTLSTEVMKCSIEQDEDQRDELSDQQPTGKRLKGLRMNRRLQELRQGEERPKKGPEGEYLPENGDIQINETSVQVIEGERCSLTPKDSTGWISVSRTKCVGSEPVKRRPLERHISAATQKQPSATQKHRWANDISPKHSRSIDRILKATSEKGETTNWERKEVGPKGWLWKGEHTKKLTKIWELRTDEAYQNMQCLHQKIVQCGRVIGVSVDENPGGWWW
eukprot:TRINITY_DN9322_c0_g3_i1.p1 TRINITY_DN9322_c0_g3~~TRINITY_DN9322_c0_g3_i1.p1  ORF type:complete len:274 (+),score=47.19 TRINITY_DN9322_c0_g3_i1:3041-3862(+)